jgi:hypothetical protein
MAVSRSANVIKSTANADSITGGAEVVNIKAIAGGAGTISLTVNSVVIWTHTFASAGTQVEQVKLRVSPAKPITVAMPGSSELYLYTV